MRPRHICRGNVGYLGHVVRVDLGFNEAAAYMPRKLSTRRTRGAHDIGFNEAAAYMPRKPAATKEPRADASPASRRPRHICRGNLR